MRAMLQREHVPPAVLQVADVPDPEMRDPVTA
jgi:hypothetical protein